LEISDFEKKRAANLIWNSAHDYTIETGFRVYDSDGRADVYWNSVIGAIHLHYDWKKLMLFYQTFHERVDQGTYESLFWLALENAVYEKEKDLRPVFPYLRRRYAQKKVQEARGQISEDHSGQRLLAVTLGHFRRALGEDAGLPDLVDVHLLDEIELGPDLTTEEVIAHLTRTLSKYFPYRPGRPDDGREGKGIRNPLALLSLRVRRKRPEGQTSPVRRMSFGYGEHVSEYGSEVLDQSHLSVAFAAYTAQSDEGMKQYITDYFGRPMHDEKTLRRLQRDYCCGNHTDVKLHITRGYPEERSANHPQSGGAAEEKPVLTAQKKQQRENAGARKNAADHSYAAKMRRAALEQAKSNEKAYAANCAIYRVQIEKLTGRIRNSLLTHLDEQTVKSVTGRISVARVWRALYLGEDKIFDRTIPGDSGNLTVDILLDASTSQLHRQEAVAAQGYMTAQALTNCGIPVRLYSFCSLNGYTILTIYRDYDEVRENRGAFRYFAAGANRDGLAIRLAAGMMKENHAEHRLLIVLSDCKPNDVIKVRTENGAYHDYAAGLGVEDTAAEVHQARMQGITVMCVFTGEDDALPNVHRIYGSDFARIRHMDEFADTVGSMLQNRIRLL